LEIYKEKMERKKAIDLINLAVTDEIAQLEVSAHCGPCTPLKMEVIRMLSDFFFKNPNEYPERYLADLAKASKELSLEPFIDLLDSATDYVHQGQKNEDIFVKLKQIQLQLQDTQNKIDEGEIVVVDKQSSLSKVAEPFTIAFDNDGFRITDNSNQDIYVLPDSTAATTILTKVFDLPLPVAKRKLDEAMHEE
jgi:hypothetical protein